MKLFIKVEIIDTQVYENPNGVAPLAPFPTKKPFLTKNSSPSRTPYVKKYVARGRNMKLNSVTTANPNQKQSQGSIKKNSSTLPTQFHVKINIGTEDDKNINSTVNEANERIVGTYSIVKEVNHTLEAPFEPAELTARRSLNITKVEINAVNQDAKSERIDDKSDPETAIQPVDKSNLNITKDAIQTNIVDQGGHLHGIDNESLCLELILRENEILLN